MTSLRFNYERAFLWIYGMIIASYILEYVDVFGNVLNILQQLLLVLMVFLPVLYHKHYSYKVYILFAIIGIILIIGFIKNRNLALLIMMATVWVAIPIDIDRLIRFDFRLRTFLCLLVLFSYFMGFTEVYTMRRTSSEVLRTDLGFGHPNIVGMYAMLFCMEYCFLKEKSLKWYQVTFLLCLTLLSNSFCDSRAAFAVSTVVCILSSIKKIIYKALKFKLVHALSYGLFPLLTLSTYIITKLYKRRNNFAILIDLILTRRIKFCMQFLDIYGINLFGRNILMIGSKVADNSTWVLDNAYFYILIRFGIIAWIIMAIVYFSIFRWIFKTQNYRYYIPTLAVLVYGIISVSITSLKMNVFILVISKIIMDKYHVVKQRPVGIRYGGELQ